MADSQETRVLKDINRHLSNIESKGISDTLSPSETAALNKNVQEIMGNFSSLIDSQLKETIKVTNKAFSDAFGKIEKFDSDAQIGLLDDVIDELQMNNRFMAKADQNNFLAEAERETELNINRRTNELLEDILENEEDASATAKAEANATKGFLSGGMGGLFGGLFAGKSIKGLMGGIKGIGKKVFFPLLITGAAVEFLRGWSEAGEDASTIEKFNNGIGRMASDLTFGLVSKKFFVNALENIEKAIGNAWKSFTKNWDEFVNGKITAPSFFANILSDLSGGALSPDQIKKIGQQIEDGLVDLTETIANAVMTGLIDPLIDKMTEQFTLLFDDPIAFFKQKIDAFKKKQKEEAKEVLARTKELQKTEGLSEKAALQRAAIEKSLEKQSLLTRIAGKAAFGVAKKVGFFSETQEEADIKAAEKRAKIKENAIKSKKLQQKMLDRLSPGFGVKVDTIPSPVSDIGSEGVKQKIADQEALRESKNIQEGTGNAMQINNVSTVHSPVDRSTENDDALNFQRGN